MASTTTERKTLQEPGIERAPESQPVEPSNLEQLKAQVKRIRAVYPDQVPQAFPLPDLLRVDRNAHQALLTVAAYRPDFPEALRSAGAESVEVIDLSLEEIFVETVKGARDE